MVNNNHNFACFSEKKDKKEKALNSDVSHLQGVGLGKVDKNE